MKDSKPKTSQNLDAASLHEQTWFNTVYQGDKLPQLTLRAVLMGSVLGGFMALSNLYVGLKTGWSLGVAITACILSFTIFKTLTSLFPRVFSSEMSILENNCMQSTASSAGYSTGSVLVSAIAAYLMITGHHMPWPVLMMFTFFLASLGIFLAIPLKRQMINIEQLRFPSGVAAAETLKSLHAKGKEAASKAKSLGLAAAFGSLIAWFRDVGKPFAIPGHLEFPGFIKGVALSKYTISFEMSSVMVAAGAIMGWRVAWSLLLGAVINYMFLAPWMVDLGVIDSSKLGYRAIVGWSTWAGASLMVTAGLTSFFMQWRTIVRAFAGIKEIFVPSQKEYDPMHAIEVPNSWFAAGFIVSGIGCVAILNIYFQTAIWMGCLAVAMSFFLGVVACRATGESDITPIGAMGKITQLSFGALAPANIPANLMTAAVTSGAASSSADLLTDLKSGYLLGANPRKQFIAQFSGIFAGTLIAVPAFYLLIPTAETLGTDQWPAPAAQTWAAVARLLSTGVEALHPTARLGMLIGGSIGIILPLLERKFPKAQRFIPSATGLGLSLVIPFFNSLAMFLGALINLGFEKKAKLLGERYIVPIASGLIAGESIMGIIIALLSAAGIFK
ncbi:MAG: OPT/YSL family transporter [Proteobacteria bacterium]|nr:OPT/YSL family transporter [Pseudomonadota bacterium]